MKILKIELQNINSLKSDATIVIDFENETFKDVGLYAITGSTGAGKTTILDAITIALYHSVPRFNATKGSLIDVVSHNAHDAFSRVTFENDAVIYEVFWGIRVADKAGKKYKNAKEEVSLKNLTTGAILATQKKILLTEINRVTQLDYNQFLRSVMLAQGDFASFLSAKGPDKGKLLEQITGEEIYKKIGQGILDRKSNEENKLRDIQSKINSDDVLSDDDKIEKTHKDKILDVDISNTEKEIDATQLIVNWYLKSKEIANQSEKLAQDSNKINIFIEKHKAQFDLLDLNEKAEPFKELIQNINRTEKSSSELLKQLKTIETELTELKPEIEHLDKLSKDQSTELEVADKEFASWLPKFDLITTLDGQLKNESDNKQKAQQQIDELTHLFESLKNEESDLSKDLTDTTSKIKIDEAFISQHKFLKEVDSEISTWTKELTTLNVHKKTLHEDSGFISHKNKELEKTAVDLQENNKLLLKKTGEIEKSEKELSDVTEQLVKNNVADIIANKEKLSITESNWKQFKNFSGQTLKAEKDQTDLLARQKTLSAELVSTKTQIEALLKQIEIQEKLLVKADKVLNLEQRIAKYEDDRQSLKKGEPCGLCGSEEHPFVDYLAPYNVSDAELALNKTKTELKSFIDSKNEIDKREVKLTTTIDSLTHQINSITEELKTFKLSAGQLNIVCELTDSVKIDIELNLCTKQIKSLDEKLIVAQQFQTQKSDLTDHIKTQNEAVTALKMRIATLNENIKNVNAEIETKHKSVDNLTRLSTDLEGRLKTKLVKFNYELPTLEHTDLFIQEIEEAIVKYNKTQKNLDALRSDTKIIGSKLSNIEKQVETHSKTQKETIETLEKFNNKMNQLTAERIAILPLNISVESKRESLRSIRNQLAEKIESSKQKLQHLLNSKTEKETLKVKSTNDQKVLIDELSTLQSSFDSQIKSSNFESIQGIELALLTKEDKLKYTQDKERIKENQLRLQALKEENTKAKETQDKAKSFEISEADSQSALEEFKVKKDHLSTEKGKIAEAFRKDQEIRDRNQEIYKKIIEQEGICHVWKELFRIIGNSKDAFNVYVQRLTLKHLLDLANVHLYKLNKRYSLKMEQAYKPKEELNFNLIDHYQTDQARLVDTSSGGEKFIISLALALGLSDLASKNVKIDSLFIDEGFGTLDSNTLETVISTLETLQSQGKMIGIISHVENLKERIPTQIQITKKSNGVSVVDIL